MNPAAYYTLRIHGSRIVSVLVLVVISLLATHLLLQLIHYKLHEVPWLLRQLFDVDEEDSIPTRYSSSALICASVLVFLISLRKRADHDKWASYWFSIGIALLVLSLDEIAGLHETLNTAIEMSWTIPALGLLIVIGGMYVRFMWHLPAQTLLLFLAAAAIFLTGAVGVEFATDWYDEKDLLDTLEYNSWTAVEEGLEMSGVVLLIHALIDYMGQESAASVGVPLVVD